MVNPERQRHLMSQSVRRPILRNTWGNEAIERIRGRPHEIGADRIVVVVLIDYVRADFDQRLQ